MEKQTTDEKVKLAIEQYNKKAKFDDRITENSYHAQFFRSGYIYGMVRAEEEGCTWGLQQGKNEIAQLKQQLSSLQADNKALNEQLENGANQYAYAIVDNERLREALQKIDAKSYGNTHWEDMQGINDLAKAALQNK